MPRVKRGVTARARHKKVLAKSKGFRGRAGDDGIEILHPHGEGAGVSARGWP